MEIQGYYAIWLSKNNKQKRYQIHRLVAEAFIPNPNNLPQVGQKDENNLLSTGICNNHVDNLEWTTAKENSNTPKRKQRLSQNLAGTKHGRCKAIKCVETGEIFWGCTEVEEKLGIDKSHVFACCQGKCYTAGKHHWEFVKQDK